MKKAIIKLVTTLAVGTFMMVPVFAQGQTTIKVIHTNDIHGNVKDDGKSTIGFAKFVTYVNEERAQNEDIVVLDAGDMFQGLPFANLEQGQSVIGLANLVGYDAMAVGNHEFDFGSANLFNNIISKLNFPMLAANLYQGDKQALDAYIIKEVDGVKVGIFGMATEETAFKSHPNNTVGYEFTDMIEAAQKTVTELKTKEEVDVVIMVAHLGLDEGDYTSDLVANAVDGIDLIVDGHSHTVLENGKTVNGTLIVSTGSAFNNVGEVELVVEDGKVVSKSAELLGYSAFENVEPNAEVLAEIERVEAAQKPMLERVVGVAAVELVGTRGVVRTGETNLGQLATDAMLNVSGADIAITNGGGIRASIAAGDITMNDMITVFPFGNTLMVKEIKGSDIKAALELGVSEFPDEKGAFPHTAGMTFTLNAYKEAGNRISDIVIGGEPMDLNKTYSVVTNDFMAAGGDGYTMFVDYPVVAEYNTLMDTLLEYVESLGVVEGTFEARMKVITEAPEVEEELPSLPGETSSEIVISIMNKYITKDGQEITVSLFPSIEQGRVMARLRDMSTLLDTELDWDNTTKTASIKDQDITFTVGENFALVNGEKVALGVATKVEDGRVLLPVGQIARILERDVEFDNTIKEVVIK